MIDWKESKDATFAEVNFFNDDGELVHCETFARPTQKTVADAVEYFDGVWPKPIEGNPPSYDEQVIIYCTKSDGCESEIGEYYAGGRHFDPYFFCQVCTRAEFEAYVKEQEGEKWTHELWGDKAYIKIYEPDCDGYLMAVTEGNGYNLVKIEDLKPIKPTLTKAEAWDKLKDLPAHEWSIHSHVMELENKYDII